MIVVRPGAAGAGPVRLTSTERTLIELPIPIRREGWYALDVRYANGNGPVNTDSKAAVRTLLIAAGLGDRAARLRAAFAGIARLPATRLLVRSASLDVTADDFGKLFAPGGTKLPDEVEARSLILFCLAISSHFLAADHPGALQSWSTTERRPLWTLSPPPP